jgi:probable HAF family extracellular repeat protein
MKALFARTLSLTLALAVLLASPAAAATYTPIILGGLAGPDGRFNFARAINEAGQVVGTSGRGETNHHATLWTAKGAIVDLGTLGGPSSHALGINNRGQVVGQSATADNHIRAFLWYRGEMTDLGVLDPSAADPFSTAEEINNGGQVVGNSMIGSRRSPFIWQSGQMQALDGLVAADAYAYAINNSGQVAGYSATSPDWLQNHWRAVVWDNGEIVELETPAEAHSFAHGINDLGQVVGSVDNMIAALWTEGKLTLLPSLGGQQCVALAINNKGLAVGYCNSSDGRHAVAWDQGAIIDLGGSRYGSFALGINNRGDIVGSQSAPDRNQSFATLWKK